MMAWVKVDDQFFRHPKTLAAGRDARDLYLVGLCYCAQALTDGFIPSASIRVLAAEAEIDTGPQSAARLVAVGLWEEVEGGYAVHDYLEYQPSKDRVLATREVRAEAGRRGGKQKASNLLDKTLAKNKQNSAPYPSRTHPNIDTDESSDISVSGAQTAPASRPAPKPRAARGTPAPDTFPITDEMQAWADERCPDVDLIAETERFLNRARSKGDTYKDWPAAWKNWMTNSYPKTMRGGVSARAPTFAGNGYVSREQAKFERSIEGLRHVGERR